MNSADWVTLIVSFALLVATALTAAATIVQARAAVAAKNQAEDARNESRAARDEAVKLSREANAAFIRQAEAQEEGNRLAREALPKPRAHWMVEQISKSRYRILNDGDLAFEDAVVSGSGESPGLIRADSDQPRTVLPGDFLTFYAIHVMGPDPVVRIEFRDPESGELTFLERTVL